MDKHVDSLEHIKQTINDTSAIIDDRMRELTAPSFRLPGTTVSSHNVVDPSFRLPATITPPPPPPLEPTPYIAANTSSTIINLPPTIQNNYNQLSHNHIQFQPNQPCQRPQQQQQLQIQPYLPPKPPQRQIQPYRPVVPAPNNSLPFTGEGRHDFRDLASSLRLRRPMGPALPLGQYRDPTKPSPNKPSDTLVPSAQPISKLTNECSNFVPGVSIPMAQNDKDELNNSTQEPPKQQNSVTLEESNKAPTNSAPTNNEPTNTVPPNSTPSCSTSATNDRDQLLYSPPLAKSPPLDKIDSFGTGQSTSSSNSTLKPSSGPMSKDGRIPKKAPGFVEHYDNMNLTELQKAYREYERNVNKLRSRREEIERKINDLMRRSRGQNIEMDPYYRQLKDDQKRCNEAHEDFKTRLTKISDKLFSKFNHKMTSLNEPSNSGSGDAVRRKPMRAKMSTTPAISPALKESSSLKNRYANLLFNFKVVNTWCQACDEHFANLEQYCDHLHTRSHWRQMKKSSPWRVKSKDVLDTRKTYDNLKSICARLGNDFKNDFAIKDLDELLYVEPRDKTKAKTTSIERERGKFRDDDPLFHIKGYDYLIPITGFYCTLCNKALCDQLEAEQHLKSGDHSYAHAKSMILNPQHEKTFRTKLEKSYKKLHANDETSSPRKERLTSPVKPSASTIEKSLPLLGYKKATSRIVDEHEIIANKFQKRPSSSEPTNKAQRLVSLQASKRRLEESDSEIEAATSTAKKPVLTVPEIVPIGKRSMKQPAALKRLRTSHKPKEVISKEYIDLLISSSDDEEVQTTSKFEKLLLPVGDPESPYPKLELSIAGTAHLKVLKDKRLLNCKVVMNRINVDDYKHMLFEVNTLWNRVHQMMTKKESTHVNHGARVTSRTEPTFFDPIGSTIPIEEATKEQQKEKAPSNNLDTEAANDSDDARQTNPGSAEDFDMATLETFFCQ